MNKTNPKKWTDFDLFNQVPVNIAVIDRKYHIVECILLTVCVLFINYDVYAQIERGRRFSKKGDCTECHEMGKFEGDKKHKPFISHSVTGFSIIT